MIRTKQDLRHYLKCDKKALGINRKHPRPFGDAIWRYEIALRKAEYYTNVKCWGGGFYGIIGA